jgi:ankyrin repeat protein
MVKIILTDKILVIEYYKIKSNPFITNNIKSIQSKDEIYIDCNYNDFMILNRNYEKNEKTEKIEKIFDLIIEKNTHIYFDDEKHFERFLDSPYTVSYHNKPLCKRDNMLIVFDESLSKKNNILFYLAHEKYDLMNLAINYGLFNKINVNYNMDFYYKGKTYNLNMLSFSCNFAKSLSSNNIIKMLLKHPKIDVNKQNKYGQTALMLASTYTKNKSTEKAVKMLLEHPDIDVNLKSCHGCTSLMYAVANSKIDSTEKTVKMLLAHPKIDVKLRDKDGLLAETYASRFSNISSTKNTVKILSDYSKKHNKKI